MTRRRPVIRPGRHRYRCSCRRHLRGVVCRGSGGGSGVLARGVVHWGGPRIALPGERGGGIDGGESAAVVERQRHNDITTEVQKALRKLKQARLRQTNTSNGNTNQQTHNNASGRHSHILHTPFQRQFHTQLLVSVGVTKRVRVSLISPRDQQRPNTLPRVHFMHPDLHVQSRHINSHTYTHNSHSLTPSGAQETRTRAQRRTRKETAAFRTFLYLKVVRHRYIPIGALGFIGGLLPPPCCTHGGLLHCVGV